MAEQTQDTGRVIKFRAWDTLTKQMYDVAFIDYEDDVVSIINFDDRTRSFDQVILLQFTGLADKNGKAICEGDIVHIRPVPGRRAGDWENWSTNERKPIVFDGGAFRFDGMNLYEMMGWGGYPAHLEHKVIGNIYENPDRLK